MQGLGTLVVLGIWTINTCQTASCTGDDNHTYAGMPESRVSNDQRAFGNGWLHRGADYMDMCPFWKSRNSYHPADDPPSSCFGVSPARIQWSRWRYLSPQCRHCSSHESLFVSVISGAASSPYCQGERSVRMSPFEIGVDGLA
jgi:hypothetical protein